MIVFVHGVPETAALWDPLRAELDRPSTALQLPGFGCALPDGFVPTKDAYAEWLAGELRGFDEPVDLVGHDWGAGLTYRVVSTDAAPVRSWAADVANIVHPEYVWHDFAKIWQTPGDGEAFFEAQLAAPLEERAMGFEMFGVAADQARVMASWSDPTMASCILGLYRSALPNPFASWGDRFGRTTAPGMVIEAAADPFGDAGQAGDVAGMLGARVGVLDGLGHWWQLQDPAASAALLSDFWDTIEPHRDGETR
jgi:pimeloyl-ACP methyl ester carboxylesterase